MNGCPENMRLLLELALNSGKKRKSAQTGYLHYCYQSNDLETHLPIPLSENFLYALSLLRSRSIENINEAKILLEGLLHFQNRIDEDPSKGNFPIYLHEFPTCKDRWIGLHVSCSIYWILKIFSLILGQELKKRLEDALMLSVNHALRLYEENPSSYSIRIKIGAIATASGQLVGNEAIADFGGQLLEKERMQPEDGAWYCPVLMGSILSSLSMVYSNLRESPWHAFWSHLEVTWHRQTACYVGPSIKEWEVREEPEVSLYDLFCGYFSGSFSKRALKDNIIHLEAALIPPMEDRFQPLNFPFEAHGTYQGKQWILHQKEQLAYSFIEKKRAELNPQLEKGMHHFKLVWGNLYRVHTFVCQGGNVSSVNFIDSEFMFNLAGDVDVEDKETHREIAFFIDAHEGLTFLVASQKANTFLLGEEVSLKDQYLSLSLNFTLEEGEGRFLGHRMLGNRPSQVAIKGADRFLAFDWQIFLRTIQRSKECRIKVSLKIHPVV